MLSLTVALTFIALDLLIDWGAFLAHFQQSWTSHFAAAKSAEYGSAADHLFDWSILLKNWDLTIPALVGVGVLAVEVKTSRTAWLPLTWLALVLLVFTTHRPWWAYYYVHLAIPLAWCAAVGLLYLARTLHQQRSPPLPALGIAVGLALGSWLGARVYFEVPVIRKSPKTFSTLNIVPNHQLQPAPRYGVPALAGQSPANTTPSKYFNTPRQHDHPTNCNPHPGTESRL